MTSNDIKTIQLIVNSEQATKRLDDLKAKLIQIKQKKDEAFEKGDASAFDLYSKELRKTQKEISKVETRAEGMARTLRNLDKATPKQLRATLNELTKQLNSGKVERGSKEWNTLTDAIKRTNEELKMVDNELAAVEKANGNFIQKFGERWAGLVVLIQGAANGFSSLKGFMEEYIQQYATMDEAKANVRKYTGLSKEDVDDLNESLKKMDTRTSREQLNALAGDAGRLGITAKDKILDFVQAADIINVALGDDLGDGAVANVGKLAMLFEEDRRLGLKQAMLSTASTINELAQNSSAGAGYLEDFTARVAGVGKMVGLTQPQIMGFAAVLDESMLQDETAATAFSQLVSKIYQEPAKFAQYAGKSVKEFSNLLKTDANAAILAFFQNLKAQGGFEKIAPILEDMNLSGTRATGVLSTIADKLGNVAKMQKLATDAYNDGTSANKEFGTQMETVQAKLDQAEKDARDLREELGEQLLPAYVALTNTGSAFLATILFLIQFIQRHYKGIISLTAAIVAYTAVLKATIAWEALHNINLKAKEATLILTIKQTSLYRSALNLAATAQGIFHVATTLMTKGLTAARIEFALLKATMAKHPFGLIAIALATVIGLVLKFTNLLGDEEEATNASTKALNGKRRALQDFNEAQRQATENTMKEIDRVQQLIKVARDEKASREERLRAIQELNNIAPDWQGNLDKEGRLHERNSKAITEYIDNLKKKALAEAMYEKLVKAMSEKMDADLALQAWERGLNRIKGEQQKPENQPVYRQTVYARAEWDYTSDNTGSEQVNENYDKIQQRLNKVQGKIAKWEGMVKSSDAYIASLETLAQQYGVDKMLADLRLGKDISGAGTTTTTTKPIKVGKDKKEKETGDPNKEAVDRLEKEKLARQLTEKELRDQGKKDYIQYQQALLDIDEDILTRKRDLYEKGSHQWNQYQKQLQDLYKQRRQEEEQWNLDIIERNEKRESLEEQRRFADGEITEEQYNKRMNEIKLKYLKDRAKYYENTKNAEKQAEYEQQVEEESNRQKIASRKEYLEQAKKMEQEYFAKSIDEREQIELALLDELIEQGVIDAKKKAEYEKQIRDKYNNERTAKKDDSPLGPASGVAGDFVDIFKRLEDLQDKIKDGKQTWEDYAAVAVASLSFVSSTTAAVSQLFTAKQQEEENAINRRYDAEIKKAGENTTKGKKLEEKRQKELAKVKQKYNKKAMKMEIAQAVASTAMAAINAYASGSKISVFLGPIAAAMAVAAGGIQIAAIKKQHEAQAEGYYAGGFTGGSSYRREAGVVHEGEFVANHRAVNNPNILPVLRLIDHAQRNNTIASLTAADVSRSISAPQTAARAAASSAPALQLIDTTQGRTAAAIERLNTKLDEGIHASVSITGEDGIERQWTRYNNLKKNR